MLLAWRLASSAGALKGKNPMMKIDVGSLSISLLKVLSFLQPTSISHQDGKQAYTPLPELGSTKPSRIGLALAV